MAQSDRYAQISKAPSASGARDRSTVLELLTYSKSSPEYRGRTAPDRRLGDRID